MTSSKHLRIVPFGLLALALGMTMAASDAQGQPRGLPGGRAGDANGRVDVSLGPPSASDAMLFVGDLQKGGEVATNGSLDGVPLLAGFRMQFEKMDHKLMSIGLLTSSPSSAKVTFADQGGNKPFAAAAGWLVLKNIGMRQQIKALGMGQFEIPLPPRPANQRYALSGFELARVAANDHPVRLVGVWIDEGKNVIRVSLTDDSQRWAGIMSERLGNAGHADASVGRFGGLLPIGAPDWGSQQKAQAVLNGGPKNMTLDSTMQGEFFATVQYALVPNDVIDGEDYFTGTSTVPSSGKSFPARGVLQGFEFYYEGRDHFVHEIGVYSPYAAGPIHQHPAAFSSAARNEWAVFSDKDPRIPRQWAAKFLSIKNNIGR